MQIVDHNGNPIDSGSLAEPQTANTAWLSREYELHPGRGLTPQRLAQIMGDAEQRDLTGQLDLADDIEERDGHAYAELSKRKLAISALEWDVVAPDDASAAEKKTADQVREWMRSLPDFEDVLHGMMDGVLKGFALHELVWQLDQGVLLPQITYRPQRWFAIAADRNTLLLRSQTKQHSDTAMEGSAPVMGEPLRPFSWLRHMPKSRTGYTARAGLVRVLAWPFLFKNYATRDLAEFLEIFGLPLRVGSYPAGATEKEKATLLRAVTQIGHNAAGIIPQGMKIDFQNAAAQGTHVPFTSMVQIMDAVQSKVILGQTLTASEGTHGTQALGNVHNEVRMDIRAADVRQVEGTIHRDLIVPLGMLNIAGFDPRRAPRLKMDIGEAEDITAYSTALPALAKAGLRIGVDWAHEKLRIPVAAEGAEVLSGAADETNSDDALDDALDDDPDKAAGSPGKGKPGAKVVPIKQAKLAAEVPQDAQNDQAGRDALDDVVDDMVGTWRETLGPMVEPLLAELDNAVARGETLAQFQARFPQLLDAMNYKPLATTLARGTFIGRLAGDVDLDLQPIGKSREV